MADSTQTYRCAYCGSTQEWDGTGSRVCHHCGATQPEKTPPAIPRASIPKKPFIFIAVALMTILGVLYVFVRPLRHPSSRPGPVVNGTAGAVIPVPASRIVRVENPHIRIIPDGVQFKVEDLIEVPEGSAGPSNFDTSLLVVRTPQRMRDEFERTIFLGEVANTSPDMVAIAPTVTVVLTRGGKTVDKATRSFADLVPGTHVPVFFHYDSEPKAFDGISFVWQPMKSYRLGDSRHARFSTSVQSSKQMSSEDLKIPRGKLKYSFERVNGTLINNGSREARSVSVYVVLRDANGQITGFDHSDCNFVSPGESRAIELSPTIWGLPVAKVEMIALPVSPPSL